MKYVVLVPDGAADHPVTTRGGATPLEAASLPNMDFLAENGICGTAVTVPEGMPAGSDVANFSLLGYDPRQHYCGRGPLEAASMGVKLAEDQVAFRCNLVTEEEGRLADYSAGHIPTEEARQIVRFLEEKLGDPYTAFHPGVGYRHLLVLRGLKHLDDLCVPPHDAVGRNIEEILPRGPGSERLRSLIRLSRRFLEDHPVNWWRKERGLRPANMIWPWGQGRSPDLPTLGERYGLSGAVITAVDLIKGLGLHAGMEVVNVPGATGYYDTDYEAKARYALHALRRVDLVYVHVEAPDEAGHEGNWEAKVEALENFDRHIVGAVLDESVRRHEEFHVLLAPDHPTPLEVGTHVPEPVPFALYLGGREPDAVRAFNEREAGRGTYRDIPGWKLMDMLVKGL
ncbi:cofactor-independent phosphoglycerate mutase [Candidatus Solincola sp.]|nr:cofactor-independent phosphoglycerate mutase [Actinomycetota bacterium]MDI7251146.1 cofactor-independent phosphoglycerate mutase [Actinomycetota bacterium]